MNNFYTVKDEQQGENSFSCKVSFDASHDIFKGHFPEQPVVPGVCMMEIVRELLQKQTGKKLWLRHAGNMKFLQLITPEIEPTININWSEGNNGYEVTASINNEAAVMFKLTGAHYELN